MLKVQTHFFQYKVAEIQVKQYGTTNFKTLRLSNIQTFWNLTPNLICFYGGSRILYRKVFVLQTNLWIPPFHWIVAREIKQKLRRIFFWTPCNDMFILCLKTCLPNVFRHVYPMFVDMCTIYLKTCLPNLWRHAQLMFGDMFTKGLKTCVPNVWKHVYTTFEDMFALYLKTCLPNVWRHVYPMFEDIFFQCLKTYFPNVWRHFYPMFGYMFT